MSFAYTDVRDALRVSLTMARRPGFTLVELLVTMAILAVLIAVLAPVVGAARAAALKVVCTTRLRDLTLAAISYRMDNNGAFPLQPGTTIDPMGSILPPGAHGLGPLVLQPPKPTDMDPAFLNVLLPHLNLPRVEGDDGPDDLPHGVQCPTVEDADEEERSGPADISFARQALYTGYAYCVRPKDATIVPTIRLLRKNRMAGPKVVDADMVVWADDVQWSVAETAWRFAHGVPRARPGPVALSYAGAEGLLGQHIAYGDGRVEWINAKEIDLDLSHGPDHKASMSVFDLYFFWF